MELSNNSGHALLLADLLQFEKVQGQAQVTVRLGGDTGAGELWLFGKSAKNGILLNAGIPVVELSDSEGYQADLGSSENKNLQTGEIRRRSAASVVLSNKDGKVLWSAP